MYHIMHLLYLSLRSSKVGDLLRVNVGECHIYSPDRDYNINICEPTVRPSASNVGAQSDLRVRPNPTKMTTEKTSAPPVKAPVPPNQHNDANGNPMKKKKRRRQKKKNSALVPAPTSVSSKKRNRSHKASGSNNGAPSPLVHLPHAKITLRHVGDVDKYGNYSKMIDLIRKLVGDVNASLLNGSANALSADKGSETFVLPEELSSIPIILEKSSIERVLLIEKSLNMKEAAKAVEGGDKKDGDVPKETVVKVMDNEQFDDLQTGSLVGINTNLNSGTAEPSESVSFPTGLKANIIVPVGAVGGRKEPEKEVYKNEISARVLVRIH